MPWGCWGVLEAFQQVGDDKGGSTMPCGSKSKEGCCWFLIQLSALLMASRRQHSALHIASRLPTKSGERGYDISIHMTCPGRCSSSTTEFQIAAQKQQPRTTQRIFSIATWKAESMWRTFPVIKQVPLGEQDVRRAVKSHLHGPNCAHRVQCSTQAKFSSLQPVSSLMQPPAQNC